MPFEQAGQSFPGSAFYYVIDDQDLPEASPWFTAPPRDHTALDGETPQPIALPPAHALAGMNNPVDFNRALTCLTQAIYYEAASEPDAGQRAVAQVVLNRLAHPAYPKTVCDVVYQGSERATGCQFTFTCDGALARKPVAWFWRRAELVAQAALKGAIYAPVGLATHYHTFAVHPVWADSLNFLDQIGAHRFYALAGPAGAAGTFRFVHSRPEPLPGPHPQLALQTAAYSLAEDPVALERRYAAAPAPANPSPRYTEDVLRHGGDSAYRAQSLPASEAIRPEYRNSGQWIAQPH
ncbi:cell wall hydrolase [Novosphingobium umbonatum]|uniref:Cell wall hydrolase n=2 Tax=Novosphingobium umbonatum TaxID=1908524 RepID=A0A3S2UW89_9SPHN|nr:cell wall hydrolase [Novosphingobium umbonatum]